MKRPVCRCVFQSLKIVIVLAVGACTIDARAHPADETRYYLQAGAFKTQAEAQALQKQIAGLEIASVSVRFVDSAPQYKYKVVVGDATSRNDLAELKTVLKDRGFDSFIRYDKELDASSLTSELSAVEPTREYFASARSPDYESIGDVPLTPKEAAIKTSFEAALSSGPQSQRHEQVLGLIDQVPPLHPLKGQMMVAYARKTLDGVNPYEAVGTQPRSARQLLLPPANGQVGVTAADMLEARKLVARILHYYERDKVTALRADKQILRDAELSNNIRTVAIIRMQIAAVTFEIAKETQLSLDDLEGTLTQLMARTLTIQKSVEGTTTPAARQVRWCTARIGLMLNEVVMLQKEWVKARPLIEALIGAYKEYPECQDEIAEAYCHLARVLFEVDDIDGCNAAADNALRIAQEIGRPVWGDPNRDVKWKAYLWKNSIAWKSQMSAEEFAKLKAEIRSMFPDHPSLQRYFPEN